MNVNNINFALKKGFLLRVDGDDIKPIYHLERLWRIIKRLVGKKETFADCRAVDVANKLDLIYAREKDNLDDQSRKAFLNIMQTLKGRVKKARSKKAIDSAINKCFFEHIIEYKKQLVGKSLALMEDYKESNENVKEAFNFLKKVQKRLKKGENPPLPLWFHATRTINSFVSINKSKEIRQHNAGMGYGAYVSSNWEQPYGDFVFALDLTSQPFISGSYFGGRSAPFPANLYGIAQRINNHCNSFIVNFINSLWVRLEENIPVNDDTLSFVIVRDKNVSRNWRLRKYNRKYLTFETYEAIRLAFHRVIENNAEIKRSLPICWKQMNSFYALTLAPEFKSQ